MKLSRLLLFICTVLITPLCIIKAEKLHEEGVSLELAHYRKTHYKNIVYSLSFSIPENKQEDVNASVEIQLLLEKEREIILDFTGNNKDIQSLTLNGLPASYTFEKEHINISALHTKTGVNTIDIKFIAGNQSLNRRDDFIYTLLVPDRARTLFPCFDQPDLKAIFKLQLDVPDTWEAIGNGKELNTVTHSNKQKKVNFNQTEPISTYLFSFVAGKFNKINGEKDGRTITLYHRETDPAKISQCTDIFNEVFLSLTWLEEYTGIPYPFEKYDLIILPGFQYGGMEHMGATLYNDRRMFLESNATSVDSLNRSSLIAHETAHMWFGDYVTMEWFNDVWNKEVFANWFTAQMVSPMYPHVNHELNFIISNYPSAYSEDRTGGAMPIQQHLDNLHNAGLIYSNVVYNKSPIVMDMLVKKIGYENFREAIREYLKKYAYGNSNWDGLISILDNKTKDDLRTWSDTWVKEKGMPIISFERNNNQLKIKQTDAWNLNRQWPLDFNVDQYTEKMKPVSYFIHLTGDSVMLPISSVEKQNYIFPNPDGKGYGYFKTDPESTEWSLRNWGKINDPCTRFSMLINLYEGVMHLDIKPEAFIKSVMKYLTTESNPQLFKQALSYAERCSELFLKPGNELRENFEDYISEIAEHHKDPAYRTLALKSFSRLASSKRSLEQLYQIWDNSTEAEKYRVSESDLIEFSYLLAIHYPDKANDIFHKQLAQITNPDRRREYTFIIQALAPTVEERGIFFRELLKPKNWVVEPWAQTALKWLNHPVRYPESLNYIRPAMDVLQEVQREGDIFFPANWCAALFSGHTSAKALEITEKFFADNPDYPKLLESKIRLRADHLYITNNLLGRKYKKNKP